MINLSKIFSFTNLIQNAFKTINHFLYVWILNVLSKIRLFATLKHVNALKFTPIAINEDLIP